MLLLQSRSRIVGAGGITGTAIAVGLTATTGTIRTMARLALVSTSVGVATGITTTAGTGNH